MIELEVEILKQISIEVEVNPSQTATPNCEPATVVLKDSSDAVLGTTEVESGDAVDILAPDGVVQLRDSSFALISTTNVKSNELKQVTAPDGDVENSDDSYSASVKSNGSLILPDIDLLVQTEDLVSLASETIPSVKDKTFTILNSTLYNALPIAYNWPQPTGQTTSYRTGDDAWYWTNVWQPLFASAIVGKRPQLANFTTLISNNSFGNKNRFTDSVGGQTYSDNYVIDHYTGLGWYRVLIAAATWNNAIDGSLSSTQNGFSDWFIANINQIMTLQNLSISSQSMNYAPFNYATDNELTWLSTTSPKTTTIAMGLYVSLNSANITININRQPKTNTAKYFLCRKHF